MANSTLLLADDSVTIQKVVNLTFSGEGIDVITVSDGNSAMDILRESPPDLVMADVNLPGINGYEICEYVRAADSGREIPVILLVGSFEPFDADESQRVGATAHLTKPFESIAALVEMVQGYLGGGASAERFDETAEYPTDADIVVSESSIPYVGGYEDETIEAESYGGGEPEAALPDDASEEPDDSPEEVWSTYEPQSAEQDEESYAAEEQAPGYDAPFEEAVEPVFEEAGDVEPMEAADSGHVFHLPASSEPAYDYHEPEPVEEEEEDEVETSYIEESVYHSETFEQRAIIHSMDDDGPTPFLRSEEPTFEPGSEPVTEAEFEPEQIEEESQHYAANTVRLDEADLLELPIDPTFTEVESEPHEETEAKEEMRFEETIREEYRAVVPAVESGAEISEELIDEIARRVVAKLSDRAVREIAWEVVPEMAEMIIRKMTEQKLNE